MLRYLNSLLGAACVLLLLAHILWAAALLAGFIGYTPFIGRIGWAFMVCLVLHGLLSVYLFTIPDRPAPRFPYPRSNAGAWAQRISGIAMILLIIPHLMEAYGHVTLSGWYLPKEPTAARYVLEALLLLAVTVHLWQGLSRLPVSLGLLRDEKSLDRWKRGLKAAVAVVTLLVLAALTRYFFFG